MTSEQKYEGKGNYATQPNQNGTVIDSTVKIDTSSANNGAPLSTLTTPSPKGDLLAGFNVSVHARGSISAADVMIFALTEYQTSRLKQATQEMASRDWGNAAESLSDSETAAGMITELALSLSRLADKNYWASVGETPEGNNYDPYSNFRTQSKHAFGWSDEQINQYAEANL